MSIKAENKEQFRAKALAQLGTTEPGTHFAKRDPKPKNVKSITILHVDDEPDIIALSMAGLPDTKYKVIGAGSVSEAIDVLRKNSNISLILCDISMPKQSGFVLLDFIKHNANFLTIPVVICSGFIDSELIQKAHAMGVAGYLAKPFSMELLLEKVETNLAQQKIAVLIVTGDGIVSKVLKQCFERKNCNAFAVDSSSEAMQALSENRVDVVISDLVLADGTGPELLAEIRKSNNMIPIFFLDDQATHIQEAKVIALGAHGIIRRPLNGSEIYRKTTAAILKK